MNIRAGPPGPSRVVTTVTVRCGGSFGRIVLPRGPRTGRSRADERRVPDGTPSVRSAGVPGSTFPVRTDILSIFSRLVSWM